MAYGTVNADVIGTSVTGSNLGAGNASIMKNRIINGAMVIDQRNAGVAATISALTSAYTLDRFFVNNDADSVLSVIQDTSAPTGFKNSLKVTVTTADASIGATQNSYVGQFIEGLNTFDLNFGTANAQTVTLSFWVRSSLTGTFGGILGNSALDYTYPFIYTISSANTWEQKTITVTGATAGTWLTTNGVGLRVWFAMGTGSTYLGTAGAWAATQYRGATGQTQIISTLNATWQVTGVQLEVGSSATGFEYRMYGQELALCQRYYGRFQGSGEATNPSFSTGMSQTTGQAVYTIQFPQTMRTLPTLSVNQLASSDATNYDSIISGIAAQYNCTTNSRIALTSAATMTAYRPAFLIAQGSTNGYIDFSAEL